MTPKDSTKLRFVKKGLYFLFGTDIFCVWKLKLNARPVIIYS